MFVVRIRLIVGASRQLKVRTLCPESSGTLLVWFTVSQPRTRSRGELARHRLLPLWWAFAGKRARKGQRRGFEGLVQDAAMQREHPRTLDWKLFWHPNLCTVYPSGAKSRHLVAAGI